MNELREKIAKICNEAKYADGASVEWKYCGEYEWGLAYDKADQIIALLPNEEDELKVVGMIQEAERKTVGRTIRSMIDEAPTGHKLAQIENWTKHYLLGE